jgi:hypothetical protein
VEQQDYLCALQQTCALKLKNWIHAH